MKDKSKKIRAMIAMCAITSDKCQGKCAQLHKHGAYTTVVRGELVEHDCPSLYHVEDWVDVPTEDENE